MIDSMRAVTEISLPGVKHLRSGKVREVFELGDELLMIATDRISAFDVVLPNGIPDKGKILNQLSAFWFESLAAIHPSHMISIDDSVIEERVGSHYDSEQLSGRSMLVKKCEPILIECVARKYIAGSLYKEYVAASGEGKGAVIHDIPFRPGLKLCDELPETIFTPATKAQSGHDENISLVQAAEIIGHELAQSLAAKTIEIFDAASDICKRAGILLADTKFEFGFSGEQVLWIDEVLTPDSSRFWPADNYRPGENQESLDKQFVRNYLETLDWDKTAPGPELPPEIVLETRQRYIQIFERLTGHSPAI